MASAKTVARRHPAASSSFTSKTADYRVTSVFPLLSQGEFGNVRAFGLATVERLCAASGRGRSKLLEHNLGGIRMPRFCAACGGQMADNATACPACGKAAGQSAGGGAAAAPAAAGGGLANNVAGLLVYLIGVLAIVFLLIEPYKSNKFVRFHCFQCLFFWGAYIVATIGMTILSVIFGMIHLGAIIGLLWFAVWIGVLVAWVMLM